MPTLAAGWSTMYPDGQEVSEAMAVYLDQSLTTMQGLDNNTITRLGSLARRFAPRWLYSAVTRAYVGRMLARQERCSSRLMTLSDIIAQEVGVAKLLFTCMPTLPAQVEKSQRHSVGHASSACMQTQRLST